MTQNTTHQHNMSHEIERVRDMLKTAVADIEADGGDISFFAAALMRAGIEMQIEVEGPEAVERAITRMGLHQLTRDGAINAC